jgi:hypothetical protein
MPDDGGCDARRPSGCQAVNTRPDCRAAISAKISRDAHHRDILSPTPHSNSIALAEAMNLAANEGM